MNDSIEQIIAERSDAHPGAIVVMTQGYTKFGRKFLDVLIANGIRGARVWEVFRNQNECDIDRMFQALKKDLNDAIPWDQARPGDLVVFGEQTEAGVMALFHRDVPKGVDRWDALCLCGCGEQHSINIREAVKLGAHIVRLGKQQSGVLLRLSIIGGKPK